MGNEKILLNNNLEIPHIGFGTWLISDSDAVGAVCNAIEAGYTMIDTASYYKNETGVGKGIKESKVKREDIFLTSKLWNDDHGYEKAVKAIDCSLKRLEVDYLDMYLVHWPVPADKRECWQEDIADTWRAMEEIYKSGKVKSIGVSNFMPHHLDVIKENCSIMPVVNQIEYHVSFMQEETVDYCKKNNIIIQAWSPLARGGVFEIDIIDELAKKYNKTTAQICLAWEINKGIIPIPKTVNRQRMLENLEALNIILAEEDIKLIDSIKECSNSGHHPDKIAF